LAVTVTDGGTISGNWVTGRPKSASRPSSVMIKEMTSDSTGRFINVSNMYCLFFQDNLHFYQTVRGNGNRADAHTVAEALRAFAHDPLAWLHAGLYDIRVIQAGAGRKAAHGNAITAVH